MAMEHHNTVTKEYQRRLNAQNQKYLRLQMKQKQENETFATEEGRMYKSQWEHTASQETTEHAKKVLGLQQERIRKQQQFQLS